VKSKVQKLNFLHASIATNNELMLLTIEGKWLKAIVHMTRMHSLIFFFQNKFNFSLQITFMVNSNSHSHLSLWGIKKTFNNLSQKCKLVCVVRISLLFLWQLFLILMCSIMWNANLTLISWNQILSKTFLENFMLIFFV